MVNIFCTGTHKAGQIGLLLMLGLKCYVCLASSFSVSISGTCFATRSDGLILTAIVTCISRGFQLAIKRATVDWAAPSRAPLTAVAPPLPRWTSVQSAQKAVAAAEKAQEFRGRWPKKVHRHSGKKHVNCDHMSTNELPLQKSTILFKSWTWNKPPVTHGRKCL